MTNNIIIGEKGIGKTELLTILANEFQKAGHKVVFCQTFQENLSLRINSDVHRFQIHESNYKSVPAMLNLILESESIDFLIIDDAETLIGSFTSPQKLNSLLGGGRSRPFVSSAGSRIWSRDIIKEFNKHLNLDQSNLPEPTFSDFLKINCTKFLSLSDVCFSKNNGDAYSSRNLLSQYENLDIYELTEIDFTSFHIPFTRNKKINDILL